MWINGSKREATMEGRERKEEVLSIITLLLPLRQRGNGRRGRESRGETTPPPPLLLTPSFVPPLYYKGADKIYNVLRNSMQGGGRGRKEPSERGKQRGEPSLGGGVLVIPSSSRLEDIL
jgi:hypothetical protein